MAEKKPICLYGGDKKELQTGDNLPTWGEKLYNGFVDRVATLSMNGANLKITGNHSIWINGVKFDKTTAELATSGYGENYFYYDSDGDLAVANSPWDILADAAPMSIVYKTPAGRYNISEERHSYNRSRAWHKWAHDTIGARWEYGFELTSTTGATPTFSIARGELHDEDITIDTAGALTTCKLWYRDSGNSYMETVAGASNYLAYLTGGNLQYDNGSGYADVGANKYICNYVYATTDIDAPIYVFLGQNEYTTVANARNDPLPAFQGMTTREWKLIHRTIWRNAGGGTFIESADYRNVVSLPAGGTTSQVASSVIFAPSGNIASTNVQAALEELDTEKQATLVSTSNIKSINGVSILGSGDLTVSGGGISWSEITDASKTMVPDEGYIANKSSLITFTLPSSAALGKILRIASKGTGGWKIAQDSGQTIYHLTGNTGSTADGTISSSAIGDAIELICITANSGFRTISYIGSLALITGSICGTPTWNDAIAWSDTAVWIDS